MKNIFQNIYHNKAPFTCNYPREYQMEFPSIRGWEFWVMDACHTRICSGNRPDQEPKSSHLPVLRTLSAGTEKRFIQCWFLQNFVWLYLSFYIRDVVVRHPLIPAKSVRPYSPQGIPFHRPTFTFYSFAYLKPNFFTCHWELYTEYLIEGQETTSSSRFPSFAGSVSFVIQTMFRTVSQTERLSIQRHSHYQFFWIGPIFDPVVDRKVLQSNSYFNSTVRKWPLTALKKS